MAPLHEEKRTRRRLLAFACALATASIYVTSFFLPVCDVLSKTYSGWDAYWFVSPRPWDKPRLGEFLHTTLWWLPNPLLWVGLVFLALGRASQAACVGLLALAIGVSCAFDLEAVRFHFDAYLAGYYCWLASMAVLAGASAALSVWSAASLTDG